MLAGLGQHQRELLAPQPGGEVRAAGEAGHLPGEALQHLVAARMAEPVVHPLEVVEVGHEQAHRLLLAARPLQLELQRVLEGAAIAQPGQVIRVGRRCQAGDQPLDVRLQRSHEDPGQRHGAHGDHPLLLGAGRTLAREHEAEGHRHAHQLHEGGPAGEEVHRLDRYPHVEEGVDARPVFREVDRQRHQHGADEEGARGLHLRDAGAANQEVGARCEGHGVDREQAGHVGARRLGESHRRDGQRCAGRVGEPEEAGGGPRIVERGRGGRVARPGGEALPKRRCPGPHERRIDRPGPSLSPARPPGLGVPGHEPVDRV